MRQKVPLIILEFYKLSLTDGVGRNVNSVSDRLTGFFVCRDFYENDGLILISDADGSGAFAIHESQNTLSMRKSCVLRIDIDVFVKRTGRPCVPWLLSVRQICVPNFYFAQSSLPLSQCGSFVRCMARSCIFEAPFLRSFLIRLLSGIDMQIGGVF